MDFHFLVMEKSWKINVEKEGAPCLSKFAPSMNKNNISVEYVLPLFGQLVHDVLVKFSPCSWTGLLQLLQKDVPLNICYNVG